VFLILEKSLKTKLLLPILGIGIAGLLIASYAIPSLVKQNVIQSSIKAATETVKEYKMLRKYYAQKVIAKVKKSGSLGINFDHASKDNVIPLPATMIHDLNELLEKQHRDSTLKLYSAYPFPNRKNRTLDDFQQRAWDNLNKTPENIFSETFDIKGEQIIRIAIADKMVAQGCVNCHNSRADSPKTDWKMGDVRGVLEVEVNINQRLAQGTELSNIFVFSLSILLLLIIIIVYFITRSITKQMSQAVEIAQRIADDDFSTDIKTKESGDEVNQLLISINRMQSKLLARLTEERKRASENFSIRKALDTTQSGLLIMQADGKISYKNRSMITKLSVFTQIEIDDIIFVALSAFYETIGDNREIQQKTFKFGEKTIDTIFSPVFNETGEHMGCAVECDDISSRLEAEKQVAKIITDAANGHFERKINTEDFSDFLKVLGDGMNQLLDSIKKPITDLNAVIDKLAEGELTHSLSGNYQGMFRDLQSGINKTTRKLRETMQEVQMSAADVSLETKQLSQGNHDLSNRIQKQAAAVEATASSMEEMGATTLQNNTNAHDALRLATETEEKSELGIDVMKQTMEAMDAITQSSQKIADILGLIDSIAFQTNLLALNASVEAARAGDQGRGFAVVAGEVRNLAQRSAEAAKDIKQLIDESASQVEQGSALVHEVSATLDEIMESIKEINQVASNIASANEEQSSGISQVNNAITNIDTVTQENAALVEETAASAESMNNRMQNLQRLVGFFKLN
jgi:methyl-accepting chemotaxis protein